MNANVQRSASRLGSFDLFKGIGMVLIVFGHTIELFQEFLLKSIPNIPLNAFNASILAVFYIISGTGFRKMRIGKCIRLQSRFMLLPYLYVSLGTVILHFLIRFSLFYSGNLLEILTDSARVAGGFMLGLPHTASYFGHLFYSCGPIWFLLSLWLGWILLNILFNLLSPRFLPLGVLLTAVIGWILGRVWEPPFCISQGMVAVLYLYMGYEAKRKKFLDDPRKCRYFLIMAGSILFIFLGVLLTGKTDDYVSAFWTLGPFEIVVCGFFALSLVYFFLRWNYRSNRFSSIVENIGRYSFSVFSFHTVEYIAVPWHLLPERFNSVALGIVCLFLMRSFVIIFLYFLVEKLKEFLQRK